MEKKLRIGIAGLGTVGVAVYDIINQSKQYIAKKLPHNCQIEVVAVSAKDRNKNRGISISPDVKWYDNPIDMAYAKDIDVIVELIGGKEGVAYELCKKAIENNKPIVTANKAMIAHNGEFLAKIVREYNGYFLFEASVAGGIPIIKLLKESLSSNKTKEIVAILNGTCNYILTEMERTGKDFSEILEIAKQKGYAEADPTFDIEGIDTAHKLSIITSIISGSYPKLDKISIKGITAITSYDIKFANLLGYKIKLLAVAKILDGKKIYQAVAPTLVKKGCEIAMTEDSYNIIKIYSDLTENMLIKGRGAGGNPTASSVLSDIIDIAWDRKSFIFSSNDNDNKEIEYLDDTNDKNDYYLRTDTKGKIKEILTYFTDNNIEFSDKIVDNDNNQLAAIIKQQYKTDIENICKNLSDKFGIFCNIIKILS